MNWQPGLSMEAVEKIVIEQALRFYHFNKTQTAQSLGISIRTLDAKMQKYGIQKDAYQRAASN